MKPKQRAPAEPDWKSGSSSTGGAKTLGDIPRPHVFRFPNNKGCRRDVHAKINTWKGTSIGAAHYYAEVELEPNAVWDPEYQSWWRPYRADAAAPEFKDVTFKAEVLTRGEAERFVEIVLAAFFSDDGRYNIVRGLGLGEVEDEETAAIKRRLAVPPLDGD